MTEIVCCIYSFHLTICHRTTLLNTDVQNCYTTLEFITIRRRVQHPSVERPPYSEKKELQLKCLKKFNAQELTAANKQARMTRAHRQLLNQYPNLTVNFMFFTDESYSLLLRRPTHRTIVFKSVRVPERRTSTKTYSFERDRHSASQSVDARPMDAGLAV